MPDPLATSSTAPTRQSPRQRPNIIGAEVGHTWDERTLRGWCRNDSPDLKGSGAAVQSEVHSLCLDRFSLRTLQASGLGRRKVDRYWSAVWLSLLFRCRR